MAAWGHTEITVGYLKIPAVAHSSWFITEVFKVQTIEKVSDVQADQIIMALWPLYQLENGRRDTWRNELSLSRPWLNLRKLSGWISCFWTPNLHYILRHDAMQ